MKIIDELVSQGYYVEIDKSSSVPVTIAVLPHISGSAALGIHLVTNKPEVLEHFLKETNTEHGLFSLAELQLGIAD
jgi:hypothetical protein